MPDVLHILEVLRRSGLSFGHFSGNLRLVDLPEFWGFLAFFLEFWKNSWVFGQLLGHVPNLEKLCPSAFWIKLVHKIFKFSSLFNVLRKSLSFCFFLSWVLSFFLLSFSFLPWVFIKMSKWQAWLTQIFPLCENATWPTLCVTSKSSTLTRLETLFDRLASSWK